MDIKEYEYWCGCPQCVEAFKSGNPTCRRCDGHGSDCGEQCNCCMGNGVVVRRKDYGVVRCEDGTPAPVKI